MHHGPPCSTSTRAPRLTRRSRRRVNDQVKAEQNKAKTTTRRTRPKPDDGAGGVLAKVG